MTIDEAILHAKEASRREDMCEECRQEHKQLADWIEELKALREKDQQLIHLTQKEFDVGTQYTYNKAIDDFVAYANTMPTVDDKNGYKRPMHLEEMAETLKRK